MSEIDETKEAHRRSIDAAYMERRPIGYRFSPSSKEFNRGINKLCLQKISSGVDVDTAVYHLPFFHI